jgi:hypothetical protein
MYFLEQSFLGKLVVRPPRLTLHCFILIVCHASLPNKPDPPLQIEHAFFGLTYIALLNRMARAPLSGHG